MSPEKKAKMLIFFDNLMLYIYVFVEICFLIKMIIAWKNNINISVIAILLTLFCLGLCFSCIRWTIHRYL